MKILKFENTLILGKNVQFSRTSPVLNYEKHIHNFYEIIYYENCYGYCKINGNTYEISPKTLFLIPPVDIHEVVISGFDTSNPTHKQENNRINSEIEVNKNKASQVIISFVENGANKSITARISSAVRLMPAQISEHLIYLINTAIEEQETDDGLSDGVMSSLLNLILSEILRQGEQLPCCAGRNEEIVRQVMMDVALRFSEQLSLRALADGAGLSPTYLSGVFSKVAGMPLSKYISNYRLSYARELLKIPKKSITEICFECGYNNFSHFLRAFKNMYGSSPAKVRSTLLNS